MKLRTKTGLFFLLITVGFMSVAGIFMLKGLQNVVKEETDEGLWQDWKWMEEILKESENPMGISVLNVRIEAFTGEISKENHVFGDTLLPDPEEDEGELYRKLVVLTESKGQKLKITLLKSSVDGEDLAETMGSYFLLAFGIFLGGMLLFQFVIAPRLWRPFDKILETISSFNLRDEEAVSLIPGNTREFRQMAEIIEEMMTKIRSDYRVLKRFTENAAHELQTPVAVALSKLEGLMQSESLQEKDAEQLGEAFQSLRKLQRLNRELLLLAKIENDQYDRQEQIDAEKICRQIWGDLEEVMDAQQIQGELHTEALSLKGSPVLLEMLLRNLIANAIRHNHPQGTIQAKLSARSFVIRNTGAPEPAPKNLFQRFLRTGNHPQSTGLGLAIAKEICLRHDWQIAYRFENGRHVFEVNW